MFENPVCVLQDPKWKITEISTHEVHVVLHKVNHEQMGSPEIHRVFHDVKTEENMFELPVYRDEDLSTQKPHANKVKYAQMGSTELQSVLRALENELNMAEASIELEHKVKTPKVTTMSPVPEKSQKKQPRKVLDKFQEDSPKEPVKISPYEILSEDQHIGEKRYICHVCIRHFNNKCRLIIHLQMHSKIKRNHCIICYTNFPSQLNLRKHMFRIHSYAELKDKFPVTTRVVNYRCRLCTQCFLHESLSTDINKRKPYVCFGCQKLFINKNSGVKCAVRCDKCPERFVDTFDLAIHKRSHAGAPKSYSRIKRS